jgi:hypothetical protein
MNTTGGRRAALSLLATLVRGPAGGPLPRRSLTTSKGGTEWRRAQLQRLEEKFATATTATATATTATATATTATATPPTTVVSDPAALQPMWKAMEGRVTGRRPRTTAETGGRTGRVNVKATDEEYWLREGLYGSATTDHDDDHDDDVEEEDAGRTEASTPSPPPDAPSTPP